MDRQHTTMKIAKSHVGWARLCAHASSTRRAMPRLLNLSLNLSLSLLLGLQASTAQAQALPAAKPSAADVLQSYKSGSRTCVNDNLPPANLPEAPQWTPDLSCAISVPELQKMSSNPDLTMLDLRSKEAFQAWHINGALNVTLADLHAKPYWRNKQVVLIGNGKLEREWYGTCSHLKKIGYSKVKVLRGGMPAWLGQQGPVLGRVTERVPQMLRVNAAEFWQESRDSDQLLLLSPTQKALHQELPQATILPQDSPDAILAVLARHRKQTKAAPLTGVLLVAPATISEEQITRIQKAIIPLPLLVYTDTRAAVQQQIALQKQMLAAQARGPRQLSCGS